eukprot:gene5056-10124_t
MDNKITNTSIHQGTKSDFGDHCDIDEMIERSGCASAYSKLEECLGESNRDWRKCQDEVKLLKKCSDMTKAKKGSTAIQTKP